MIKKQCEKMALSCHSFEGRYKSPEIKTADLLFEGVVCSSGLTQQFVEEDYSDGGFWDK